MYMQRQQAKACRCAEASSKNSFVKAGPPTAITKPKDQSTHSHKQTMTSQQKPLHGKVCVAESSQQEPGRQIDALKAAHVQEHKEVAKVVHHCKDLPNESFATVLHFGNILLLLCKNCLLCIKPPISFWLQAGSWQAGSMFATCLDKTKQGAKQASICVLRDHASISP